MFLKVPYSAWVLVLLMGRTVNALPIAGADIGSVVDASQPAPPASAKAELPTRQLTPPPSEDRRRRPWEQPIPLAREEEIKRGDPPQSDYDLVSASTINVA
ncbi:hypothetical protein F4825DRAFT_451209 [Nemania diffusa]|nr:hypothetical protein F4825DRAFT_451209 [Nemania diffusa]